VWDIGTSGSNWFVLETNYDHWKPPPVTDDRRSLADHCMEKMTQEVLLLHDITAILGRIAVLARCHLLL